MLWRVKTWKGAAAVLIVLSVAACESDYPQLAFEAGGDSLTLNGVIDARALGAFDQALEENPNVRTLVFEFVPGSADDESNLKLARKVRAHGLNTVIPEGGLTASGGTDLFLAGAERTLSGASCVGVHTWGNEWVGIGSDVPKDDPIHYNYINYYRDIGIPEEFYWFTLDAAGPDDSHWMSSKEIEMFKVATSISSSAGSMNETEQDRFCERRIEDGMQRIYRERESKR